jgi:hypothetical protein
MRALFVLCLLACSTAPAPAPRPVSPSPAPAADDDDDDEDEPRNGAYSHAEDEDEADDESAEAAADEDADGEGDEDGEEDEDGESWTSAFTVAADEWTATGRNPWFSLVPGDQSTFEGGDSKLVITVLDETRTVDGVQTRVIEEREWDEGQLEEVSRNFFALSKRTNSVYYFGEEVDIYKNGRLARHEGAWMAGENGAHFGMIMPGEPLLGSRYAQEIAPDVAMDRAEVVGLAETLTTPAGTFTGCLKTEETSPLEPRSREHKLYAPGVGLIQDGEVVLVKVGRAEGK